jgi:hypothetical protein
MMALKEINVPYISHYHLESSTENEMYDPSLSDELQQWFEPSAVSDLIGQIIRNLRFEYADKN